MPYFDKLSVLKSSCYRRGSNAYFRYEILYKLHFPARVPDQIFAKIKLWTQPKHKVSLLTRIPQGQKLKNFYARYKSSPRDSYFRETSPRNSRRGKIESEFVKGIPKLFFDGALWKIESERERNAGERTHSRARVCDGIGRSHKFPYGMHTPTSAFTYARCMITAALRSDGQVALGSPAHADVLREREWNLKRERVNVKENVRKGRKTMRGNGNRDRRSDRYPTYVSISRDLYREYRGEERRRGFPSLSRKISRASNRKILLSQA